MVRLGSGSTAGRVFERERSTWQIWEGSFASGEGGYGCWTGDLGDGGEIAEAATGSRLAEEDGRHVESTSCVFLKVYCRGKR